MYSLFAESIALLIGSHGRAGMIVPTGIATDDSTKTFFDEIASSNRIASLYDFENREKLFPAVDSRMRFCALTLGIEEAARFVFFASRSAHLRDENRAFKLSSNEIALLNPNTRTCPIFRSRIDAALTCKIYERNPVLINEQYSINPWKINFQEMIHMSNDSGLFKTSNELSELGGQIQGSNWIVDGKKWIPLYEGKMVQAYDHRAASVVVNNANLLRSGQPSINTELNHIDPYFCSTPQYWIQEEDVDSRLNELNTQDWFIGFKKITSPTNERTFISAIVPKCGMSNSMVAIFSKLIDKKLLILFYGNLNSLVFDYSVRGKIGGLNLNFYLVKQFPIISPDIYSLEDMAYLAPRILELTYTSYELTAFAADMGYLGKPFKWDTYRRAQLRAELDAYYAKLYGLTRDDLRYILDPSDVYGEEFPSVTFPGLKRNEINEFGEYRTRRLVLEAWDKYCAK
jgi:hypothetical protein